MSNVERRLRLNRQFIKRLSSSEAQRIFGGTQGNSCACTHSACTLCACNDTYTCDVCDTTAAGCDSSGCDTYGTYCTCLCTQPENTCQTYTC
jgi:hypothetical protein